MIDAILRWLRDNRNGPVYGRDDIVPSGLHMPENPLIRLKK